MPRPPHLALLFAALLLAACTERPPTAPEPAPTPEDATKVIAISCQEWSDECATLPPNDWDTYPVDLPIEQVRVIETQDFAPNVALYDDPVSSNCELSSKIIDAPDADGYTKPTLTTVRSANCPSGPCGGEYQSARADFHSMMAGAAVLGGSVVAATFLGPGGQAVRIVATRYILGASTGGVRGLGGVQPIPRLAERLQGLPLQQQRVVLPCHRPQVTGW